MEPNLIYINDPVTVIGDLHGQFYDLIKILSITRNEGQKHKHLFLGDYVDRGLFSIQTLLLILAMKINSPKNIIMLRGNHECRQLTTHFNFRSQCIFSLTKAWKRTTKPSMIQLWSYLICFLWLL